MRMNFMTGADFNKQPSRARQMADLAPLVVTEHGKNRYVLMSYGEFEKLQTPKLSLFEALNVPPGDDRGFEPKRLKFEGREVEFR